MAAAQKKNTYTAAEVAVLEETILKQKNEIEELKRKLDHMNEVFANAQRARFGQSSEKASYVMSEDQVSLFNEAEKEQDHKAEEPTEETFTVKAHARKKKRTLEEMTENLPEKEILLELPEDQRICGKCGGMFKPIGKKFVRHELQVIPRQVKLLAYYTVTHCGCWTHMKRKWREAMPDGATVKTSKAAVGFQYCNKLFSLEKKCATLNNKLRKEYRQNFILPVLEEYFCWVNTLNPEKGSKLAEAVTYAKNQRSALTAFVEHGDVPISNNLAENAIRPFALGRKNWLFCDTVKGAESSAIVYSMVETAKANGLDPYDYLLYALSVLPYYGKSTSHEMLETAMPWSSEVQQQIGKKAKTESE